MKTDIQVRRVKRKTYLTGKPNIIPYFIEKKQYQGACGKVYPLPVTDQILDVTEDREYDMVYLENEYISVHLLPEIGGKIYGASSKKDGYEFIYENPVVKPALIGLAGSWVSGGVEFNWPQHHRPTTFMPVEYRIQENEDGSATCFMGEAEPFEHTRGMAAITVRPASSLVELKALVTNTGDHPLPFMWWNNLAVRVHDQYKVIFPSDVEYGADHDRRAIVPFPVMRGRFETARPFDYGKGVDAGWYGNVKVQTSVMIPRGESKMDYLGGYDFSKGAGTVVIADHHVSPGKKMFTWSNSEFGKKWCGNLTDNGDCYIELMTGTYTDNQPDFAYIEPGETKEFSTFWYPIHGIEGISNANVQGAVVLEKKIAGLWKVGAVVTGPHPELTLKLAAGERAMFERKGALDPDDFWLDEVTIPENIDPLTLRLTLEDADGRLLVSYMPVRKGEKQPPRPRDIAPDARDVDSVELLYLYGRHLAQYKHGTYCPEDYFLEALRRSSEDYRCNLEMGKIEIEKGRFREAEGYLRRAAARITFENTSPEDPESYYQLGRVMRLQGRYQEAYELFRAASWQYAYRSPGFFESACISCMSGSRERAIGELREALVTNTKFYYAKALLGYLTKNIGLLTDVLREFPQECASRYALYLLEGRELEEYVTERPETVLDAALLFEKAGLIPEAVRILQTCTRPSLNLKFHLTSLTGGTVEENLPLEYDYPNRLEDIRVLRAQDDWRAQYLLGCLYYARDNYEEAARAWEFALEKNGTYGALYRNLAFAYYDHLGKREKALPYMRKAAELGPDRSRIVYELLQLEREERVPLEERIRTTETFAKEIMERDDAYLDAVILRIQAGEYNKALMMLSGKSFHIYEGGEGKLTKYHRWLYILKAEEARKEGNLDEAEESLRQSLIYPTHYGEGKGVQEQDANVYYFAGLLEEEKGRPDEAAHCYRKVDGEPEAVNEILFFAALCYEKLGNQEKAGKYYHALLSEGQQYEKNMHRYGYFGVGMESPIPFGLDIRKRNGIKAYTYQMLGYLGLKQQAASHGAKLRLKALDPDNPLLGFLERLEVI